MTNSPSPEGFRLRTASNKNDYWQKIIRWSTTRPTTSNADGLYGHMQETRLLDITLRACKLETWKTINLEPRI